MEGQGARRRTGGRSARVRAAVHRAVAELLTERGEDAVTIAAVAARSGVNPTSLYRRWGTRDALVLDVAVHQMSADVPVPDTGSLHTDLLGYARAAAAAVARPDGLAFLRAVLGTNRAVTTTQDDADVHTAYLARLGSEIQTMLDRAARRGEPALDFRLVLDGIVAPIYLRRLFRYGGVDEHDLEELVRRVLPAGER